MKKYATFGANGRMTGRYDSEFNVIPVGARELTEEQFRSPEDATGYLEVVNGAIVSVTPPPPQAPVNPVPSVISMRQARLALLQSGLLAQVDASIAAMPEASRIEWEFAATVERSHSLVTALASDLPLTSQQLDDLFTLGASL